MRGLAIFSAFATVRRWPTDNLSGRAIPTPRFPGPSPGAYPVEDRKYDGQFVRQTEQLRCTMKIRNRSDQRVKALSLAVIVASASGGPGTGFELSPGAGRSLAPGQEADITACGGGGSGGASGNHIRILVYVGRVDWDGCFYVPSIRLPYELGIFVQ